MLTQIKTEPVADYRLDENETRFYRDEGWLLLPDVLDSASVAPTRTEVLEVLAQLGMNEAELSNASEIRHKLLQTSQYLPAGMLNALVNSPHLKSIATQLLGGACQLYMPFTAVKSGGGGGKFHFHQDNNYTRFENGLHGINFWFALEDMTPDNGALCIEPRSHLKGTLAAENVGQGDNHQKVDYEPASYLPVRMRAGDAIAFSRLTVHGSMPNITADPRVAYSIHFHRDEVMATWDGQEPRRLKGAARWHTGPVDKISAASQ